MKAILSRWKLKRWTKRQPPPDPIRDIEKLMEAGFTQGQALQILNCIANYR